MELPEHIVRAMSDSTRQRRESCLRRGLFTSVVLGLPEAVHGEEAQEYPGAWKVRAFRTTTSDFFVWDVYFGFSGGAWRVLGTRRIFGMQS
jgi:hypothetical protein